MEVSERATLSQATAMMLGYNPDTETHVPYDFDERHRQYHRGTMASLLVANQLPERNTTTIRNILYFANMAYTISDRYTISASIRKDPANIFGVDINKRGRPFWSAGASWHLHKEEFMSMGALDKLTLRLTHGYTGNVSNRSAYITSAIAPSPAPLTGEKIYQRIVNPPNPQLSWENVETTNAAIDVAVLGGRLSGTVEYYWKKAAELLSSAPINPSSGVTSLYGNWSALKGHGLDVELEGVNLTGRATWRTSLLFSLVGEQVTDYKLRPSNDRDYLRGLIGEYPIEGRPLYTIYSLPWAGLDGQGQPRGFLDGEISQDYANIYNNTSLSEFVYHGRATPSVFGGLRNTVSVAGWDVSFNIVYQLGYYFRRNGLSYYSLMNITNHANAIFHADYSARWMKAGDEAHTDIPAMQYPVNSNRESFYGLNETLVERADHIRLQDVRVSYSLGGKLQRWRVSGLQVFLYANNLGLIWKANGTGVDPDAVPSNGLVYPTPMSFSFGFNLNL
ncbi:hypothetical protein [Parapedobacter sp. 10938]|uniref:hypothetical protein n=1 Tax=Parapedobacter flavus TaxID=3110225 RepID=UPI002DBB3C0B|nr:hypothetical protein [Parapedobacter sp. 10938]MEC3879328.1 hypothetical protein [Parapedobacter sp. 10938]